MAPPAYLPFARPTLDDATVTDVGAVLRSGWLASGPKEKAFEAALTSHVGGRPVRVVSSGTAALELALNV
ncbi:MAG: DegT/DnrJ/EryC1/StrS family aminotransferase, partial [Casimicrobiaceae bacterium]